MKALIFFLLIQKVKKCSKASLKPYWEKKKCCVELRSLIALWLNSTSVSNPRHALYGKRDLWCLPAKEPHCLSQPGWLQSCLLSSVLALNQAYFPSFLQAFHYLTMDLERSYWAFMVLLSNKEAATTPYTFCPISLQNCIPNTIPKLWIFSLKSP